MRSPETKQRQFRWPERTSEKMGAAETLTVHPPNKKATVSLSNLRSDREWLFEIIRLSLAALAFLTGTGSDAPCSVTGV